MASRHEELARILGKAFDVLEGAFKAETVVRRYDGTCVTLPDHHVRLEAVKVFVALLAALSYYGLPKLQERADAATAR